MSFSREMMNVLRGMDAKKLDQKVVSGNSKFLTIGTHDVVVVGFDTNKLSTNMVTVKYAGEAGGEHNDMIFMMDQNKKTGAYDLNWKFAGTLGMLIPSIEAYEAFLAEMGAGNKNVFDYLIGCKGRIVLTTGKGYTEATTNPLGGYTVHNALKPEEAFYGETIEEAQTAAKKAGILRRSYPTATKYIATEAAANIALFTKQLVEARANGSVPAPQRPRMASSL